MVRHWKFTGKYKDLIPMGFTFQRLYADNYISYHKGNTFIFRKGNDVTISAIQPTEEDEKLIEILFEKNMIQNV